MSARARRVGAVLGGYLVLYALLLGTGLLLTRVLGRSWSQSHEDVVNRDLAAQRGATMNAVTRVWSELGDTAFVAVTVVVVGLVFRRVFGRWRESLFVLLAAWSQSVVFLLVQLVVARRRPDVPHLDDSPPTSSFPSGHTSASVALYGATAAVLLWRTRRTWLPVAVSVVLLLLPVLVAWSRLYRGMHHPTDVATSVVSGACCIALAWQAVLAGTGPRASRQVRPARDGPAPTTGVGAR